MSGPSVAAAAADAAFLEGLRRRVARPAEAAARLRQGLPLEVPVAEPVVEEPHAAEAPRPEPVPAEPAPAPPAASHGAAGDLSLWSLERIAREAAASDPSRAEELSYTLLYLRHYADPSGHLPASFSELVGRVFAPAG